MSGEKKKVCKDWVDLVCNRGNRCHYEHPPEIMQPETRLHCCRDFQNKADCQKRAACTRLHLTITEESNFYKTGVMPEHGGDSRKVSGGTSNNSDLCKDEWKSGGCPRGSQCRYRHTAPPVGHDNGYTDFHPQAGRFAGMPSQQRMVDARPPQRMVYDDVYEPPMKRHAPPTVDGAAVDMETWRLKVDEERKKVTDLRDMNDKLYGQNNELRKQLEETRKKLALYESGAAGQFTTPYSSGQTTSYGQISVNETGDPYRT